MPAIVAFVIYLMYGKDKMRPDDGGNGTRSGKITPTASPGFLDKPRPVTDNRTDAEARPSDGNLPRGDELAKDRLFSSEEEAPSSQHKPTEPIARQTDSVADPAIQDRIASEDRSPDTGRNPGSGLFRESDGSSLLSPQERRGQDKDR